MRMSRETSQLLIIDVQEKLLPTIDNHENVSAMCARLIYIAKEMGVPITISEQYPKGLGSTVAQVRDEAGNSTQTLDKVHFSCLSDNGLAAHLRGLKNKGHRQIVIGGIESHVCVLQTALDLVADGFDVYIAADAVSSRAASSRRLGLARLARAGAEIVDSEMVMFEWLEKSGTPEFKKLQELLK